LATIVDNISEVKTVVRSYLDIDVVNYKESELPLVNIREPSEESYESMTSQRSIMDLKIVLRVYFVSWNETPTTTYETLVKKIRDAIGENFTLNGKASGTWVDTISALDGNLPVYFFDIELTCRYYLNEKNC
ncbi:MAG: hypothetical protein ACTSR3_23640, partial [Candidatus Helarchaeota archaeon]